MGASEHDHHHDHDHAAGPAAPAGAIRRGFEWCFNTTIEEERLRAVRDYVRRSRVTDELAALSDTELAAHRMNGMDDYGLAKTRVRFAQTLRCVKAWTSGAISASRVLDIGASDGLLLKLLGLDGTGLDVNPHWPLRMKAKGIAGVEGLAEALPFRDKAFDYVMCFECLEHVENPIALLREIERVCRRSVFLSIPWVGKTRIRADNYHGGRHTDADHHVFEFGDKDFRKIISHTGFQVAHHEPLHIYDVPVFGMAAMVRRRMQLHAPSWSLYELSLQEAR